MTEDNREKVVNCWEFLKCGREPGGKNAHEMGICPATIYTPANDFMDGDNGGRACMYITGTFCSGEVQGTHKDKEKECANCQFYKQLKETHEDMGVETYNKYIKNYFDDSDEDKALLTSAKINAMILRLSEGYFPFNKISKRRLLQIVDLFRIVDLERGEILQLRENKTPVYLYILKGNVDLVQNTSIRSFSSFDTQGKPVLLTKAMGRVTLVASEPTTIFIVDKYLTDDIVGWDSTLSSAGNVDRYGEKYGRIIGKSLLLRNLPKHTLDMVMERLVEMKIKKGEVIMKIGKPIDRYYIISSGKAEIFVEDSDGRESKIAELEAGDSFGAYNVISESASFKKISMLEDSVLLALSKDDFVELIHEPLVETVSAEQARDMIGEGYKLLDVRFSEEHDAEHIPDSLNIPLPELQDRMSELDLNEKYIIYSQAKNRCLSAAILLKRNNYQAVMLEKGLRAWPFEQEGSLHSFNQRASIYGVEMSKSASRKRSKVIRDKPSRVIRDKKK